MLSTSLLWGRFWCNPTWSSDCDNRANVSCLSLGFLAWPLAILENSSGRYAELIRLCIPYNQVASLDVVPDCMPRPPAIRVKCHEKFYICQMLHTQTLLHTDPLTHRQKILHTNPFTHRHFDTETLWHTEAATHGPHLHTDPLTHKRLHSYTHTLLHPTPVKSQIYLGFYTHCRCDTETPFTQKPFYTHTHHFTQRRFNTQTLLHKDTFTHRSFYTQTLLHRCTFTHKHFYTQTSLHRNTFTHKPVYTQTLSHTEAFTHRHFYTHTQTHTHKHFYTQTLLHTDRNFYTQTLLHTDTLTQKPFDTQKLRRTDPIYTQTLLHTNAYTLTLTPFYIQHQLNRNFTAVFAHRASFRAKGLLRHK